MILNIDENNPSELKRVISRLQKRRKNILRQLGYDGISFQGSQVHAGKLLPLLETMIATDMSSVYGVGEVKNSYVYAHCDPTVGLNIQRDLRHLFLATKFKLANAPFYIGKGEGLRCYDLARNDGHRKIRSKITSLGKEVEVIKIADNLTESEALALEAKLIDILGIRHLGREGILINLDEGAHVVSRRQLYPTEVKPILRKNGFVV